MTTFQQKHGRPKPPAIWVDGGRTQYELDNPKVATVYRSRREGVWRIDQNVEEIASFPTHAEAIAYAHKMAHQ